MSSPKHLWSGDWEQHQPESPAPSSAPPAAPVAPEPTPSSRRQWERGTALAFVAVLVLAGVVWAVVSITQSNGHHRETRSTAGRGAGHAGAVTRADALGLELESANNRVVVAAVAPGSPATAVGTGAGDTLLTLNGQTVTSPAQFNAILDKLPLGSEDTMELAQGAQELTAEIQETGVP